MYNYNKKKTERCYYRIKTVLLHVECWIPKYLSKSHSLKQSIDKPELLYRALAVSQSGGGKIKIQWELNVWFKKGLSKNKERSIFNGSKGRGEGIEAWLDLGEDYNVSLESVQNQGREFWDKGFIESQGKKLSSDAFHWTILGSFRKFFPGIGKSC